MDIDTYLESPGALSVAELAKQVPVPHVAQINQWRKGCKALRRPGFSYCAGLERVSEGRMTCEELNPGLPWTRIPDPAWPWHPNGRPMVDASATSEVA